MRPREIARTLVDHRAEFRRLYRDTVAALRSSCVRRTLGAVWLGTAERYLGPLHTTNSQA